MAKELDGRALIEGLEEIWRDVPTPPGVEALGTPYRLLADEGEVGYYSWEEDGQYLGLLRLSGDRATFSRVSKGEWVEDRDLFRHLVNPGCDGPDLIDRATAEKQAARYGVKLDEGASGD